MPELRGHHLICLHFFRGEGYNEGFIKNLVLVLKSAEHSPIRIAHDIDDVCVKCPHVRNDRCGYADHSDPEIREMDKRAMDLLNVERGAEIAWTEIRERIPGIFRAWHDSYCIACGWRVACEKNDSFRRLAQFHDTNN